MLRLFATFSAATATLFLGSQNCYGQSSGNINALSDIYACADISDSVKRLSCYDTAANRLETAQQSGEIVTFNKSEIDQVKKDTFGLNQDTKSTLEFLTKRDVPKAPTPTPPKQSKSKKKVKSAALKIDDLDEVKIEISRTKTFGYEKTRFYLTNGQVWDQVDSYKIRMPRVKNGNPNSAEIRKAALGSFLLRVNGKGRAIRVRRTR